MTSAPNTPPAEANAIRLTNLAPTPLSRIYRNETLTFILAEESPEWLQAATAVGKLQTAQREAAKQTRRQDPLQAAADVLLGHALSDDPMPDNIEETIARQRVDVESANLVTSAYTRALHDLTSMLNDATRDAAPAVFDALDSLLGDVTAAARKIESPSALLDPAAVLASERVEEHREWTRLTRSYTSLRRAQATLMKMDKDAPESSVRFPEALAIREVDTVFEHWSAWRARGYLVDQHNARVQVPLRVPWPLGDQGNPALFRLGVEGSSPEFFAWAIEAEATLWIPNERALRTELQRLAERLNDPDAAPVEIEGETTTFVEPRFGPRHPRQRGLGWFRAGGTAPADVEPYVDIPADIAWMFDDAEAGAR